MRICEWHDLWPWFDNQIEHAEQDSCLWHLDFRTLLHASCVIVRQLCSTTQSANESKVKGIFCMLKRPDMVVRYVMLKNEPFILSVKYSGSPETLVGLCNFGCAASWTIACLKGRICFLWLVINAYGLTLYDFLCKKRMSDWLSCFALSPHHWSLVTGRWSTRRLATNMSSPKSPQCGKYDFLMARHVCCKIISLSQGYILGWLYWAGILADLSSGESSHLSNSDMLYVESNVTLFVPTPTWLDKGQNEIMRPCITILLK